MLRNLYFVTKTLCKLMISLRMVSLLKNLCENTATLLAQSRLISRADAAEMMVALEEGHLPGQIKLVTSAIKGHIKKDCRSMGHGSSVNTPNKSINELPKWVTRKPVDSATKDLITATMTCNNKK